MSTTHAARRVDAKEQLEKSLAALGGSSHRAKREARRLSVRDLMGAGPETDLQVGNSSYQAKQHRKQVFKSKFIFSFVRMRVVRKGDISCD